MITGQEIHRTDGACTQMPCSGLYQTQRGEPCRRENMAGRRRCWRKGRGKTGDEDKVCCLVSSGQTAPKKGTLYSMML